MLNQFTTCQVAYWAKQRSESIAWQTSTQTLTWRQLDQHLDTICIELSRLAAKPNQICALIGKNSPQLLMTYLACIRFGLTPALIAPAPESVIHQKLNRIGANWVWREDEFISYLDVEHHEVFASLIFTSGSTGEPKAVAHKVSAHQASAKGLLEGFEFKVGDSWLLSLPMYHVSGLGIVWRWLVAGACIRHGSKHLNDDLAQVTHASLVATQLHRFLNQSNDEIEEKNELCTLKLKRVLLGGSHVPSDLIQASQLAGIETWLGYGMTETASTVTAKKCDDIASAGHILAYRELKIESEKIWVKGDVLASGYYQIGQLTPLTQNKGDWFNTKDLGRWILAHGGKQELVVIGRADNLFISGGENIHCEEIEAHLNQHPKIKQALVIPIDDAIYGQRPIAFIEVQELESLDNYQTFLAEKIVKFKHPDAFYLIPDALLNTGIKVSRAQLKQYYIKHYKDKT